ncbi:YaiI/YqxD family protein [Polycladidibacter hongkongensis]|uniref:YaiI/YqxD family protein n=1 Tax=Polycladidibacter hongkongensis TaxID=1647556 RepID=UPI000831D24B|nr:YaiI/YqxD family protein [Pseudovibrio hongkongensis]
MVNDSKTRIYIDADACPVKDEVYRVAERYGLKTYLVANSFMRVPRDQDVQFVKVEGGPDKADDYIAEQAQAGDVVVTQDIPLADRCLKNGAKVLSPKGKEFDSNSIGMALATRNLKEDLRSFGEMTGGPKPFSAKDRSDFLQALDRVLVALLRS